MYRSNFRFSISVLRNRPNKIADFRNFAHFATKFLYDLVSKSMEILKKRNLIVKTNTGSGGATGCLRTLT